MTDAAQAEIAAPEIPAKVQRVFRRSPGYLFGPLFDFMTLGGGSIIACGLIAAFLPKGIPDTQQAVLITVLMTVINQPHFAHSYQMFYRNFGEKAFGTAYSRELRLRYIFAGMIVPAALTAFLSGAAIAGSARVLAYGANLMFFLVGWHYVKQGYGILMVDSVQKRVMFSDRAKTVFRLNGYACWILAWLAVNHAISQGTLYLGLTYFSFPVPEPVYRGAMALVALTTLAAAIEFLQRSRESRGALPWNGVIAYLTTLYLWVIFVRINPLVLAVVPTFHSLQYLAVVWRYQLNAGSQRLRASHWFFRNLFPDEVLRNLAVFVGAGVVLGFLGFAGIPRSMEAVLSYDKHLLGPSLFLFLFYIFINVHHYFLDNVMWRRGNPDVQQYVFGRAHPSGR